MATVDKEIPAPLLIGNDDYILDGIGLKYTKTICSMMTTRYDSRGEGGSNLYGLLPCDRSGRTCAVCLKLAIIAPMEEKTNYPKYGD